MRLRWSLLLLSLAFCPMADAQVEVKGYIVDSATQERLPSASVSLLREGKPLKFTRTDASGFFVISVPVCLEKDELQAVSMGHRKLQQPVVRGKENVLRMSASAFCLKEVQVKGARVFGVQDTVTYDLTRFADARDNSLKDVLKKLPGVDVDAKSGLITYNGKSINRFTVEGLDLTGGRYNQLEDNLKAKDVKKAEIIEHDQPVKALRNKVFTDNVAMNIGLKEEARDRLLLTLSPYLLVGEPTHVGGSVTLMQMGKKKQRMYEVSYDRTGKDLMQGLNVLGTYSDRLETASLPSWLSVPSLQAPLDDDRLRFNTSQKYTVNELRKGKQDAEWRFNASYLRSVIRQHTMNVSSYRLGDEAPVTTSQDQQLTLFSDDFTAEAEHKVNTDHAYGNEFIRLKASQNDGLSAFSDTLRQRIRVPQIGLTASLYRLFSLRHGQLSWRSVADYQQSLSDLYVNAMRTPLNTRLWHTAHTLGWLRKQGYFTQQYTAGVDLQNLNIGTDNLRLALSLTPYWQYERGSLLVSLTPAVSLERFCHQQQSFCLLHPSLYLRQRIGHRSEWTLFGSYRQQTGDWSLFGLRSYRSDYRSYCQAADFVPLLKTLSTYLSYDYKRPIEEFFFHGSVTAARHWSNAAADLQIEGGNYFTTLTSQHALHDDVCMKAGVSKGFYRLHLKTSLDGSATYAQGCQLSAGRRTDYRVQSYVLTPMVEYTSSWCALSYEGNFLWHASKAGSMTSTRLFGWKQTLSATATIGRVDVAYSLMHLRNELQEGSERTTLLSDISVVCRLKAVRLTARLSNLFNKRSYEETRYSGISTFTDAYSLRPRETLLTAQLTL
ncbi:MAG: carboxypeptidase-like regulatory domain-containing protein [Prevotella sp.]|jgi:hypothetical protein|nr:carboxypeptidase-like regulatory domain-containing protein [Prevotella sp.]MCI1281145.1 carboxypeptidase-like regulatory domain-containing protein [Prevotella sp.]